MVDEPLKAVPGYPGLSVTKDGRVRGVSGIWLKPVPMNGYLRVSFSANVKPYIHILVCLAWHGPCPTDKDEVGHRDGNKHNNHADNLRWVTKSENEADKLLHGGGLQGSRSPNTKLTETDVIEIRRLRQEGMSIPKLAAAYKVSTTSIFNMVHRKTWRHV